MLAALNTSEAIALGAGIVALLSFVVAVWSVTVARKANKLSKDANKISAGSNALAQESNDIARDALEHSARGIELAEAVDAERQRERTARAVVRGEITTLFHTVQATSSNFRALVRVENSGDRDSGPTVVRVYMPAGSDLMAWDDEHARPDRVRPIHDPQEVFEDGTGARLQTQYLERRLDNVTTTMPHEFRVILPVPIPPEGHGRQRVPVRVRVRAANADDESVWTDYVQTEYGPPAA